MNSIADVRTGIYVKEPSSVTIRATDPRDAQVQLCKYKGAARPAIGTHRLEPGIYLIVSNAALEIELTAVDIAVARGKDNWPVPPAAVVALESGATADSIQSFFLPLDKEI